MNLKVKYGHQDSISEPFYKIDEQERQAMLEILQGNKVILFNSNSHIETRDKGMDVYNSDKNQKLLTRFDQYGIKTHVADLTYYRSK